MDEKSIPPNDPANVRVVTNFTKRIGIGLAQYIHDNGLPFTQDAVRLFVAKGLEAEGYPKEIHVKFPGIVR